MNCNNERTLSFAKKIIIPSSDPLPIGAKFNECCYVQKVYADDSGALHKNDFSGFFYQKQVSNERCDFVLINLFNDDEYDLNDGTFGQFVDFGNYENGFLKTFVLDWSKVLSHSDLGSGNYKVVSRIVIAGIEFEKQETFFLREYSDSLVDGTIRMDIELDGFLEYYNADFKNTKFKTSLRMGGFFGNREAKHEEDNIVYRNKEIKPISFKQTNEYKMQTELLPDCMTKQIYDLYLFADKIYMNDYNLNNHSYRFKNFLVRFEKNDNTDYHSISRKARLNLTFSDKILNRNKFNY